MNDWLSDTHIAGSHTGNVNAQGNVTPEDAPKGSFQPDPFAVTVEQIKRAQVSDAALAFAFKGKALDKAADKFLKQNGAKLKWARGGSQLK